MTSQPTKFIFRRGTYSGHSSPPRMNRSDVVFAFNRARPTTSVSVEGVPENVDPREVISLFSALIGEVRSFQEVKDGAAVRLDITFFDRDTATKALCMNGYTVGDSRLAVSALTMSTPAPRSSTQLGDTRRNLYVLGLPFALTKNEFAALFSQYGTVSHCVILATVDNSSRRRGFIVMSTHDEAKAAIEALTRIQIKGHTIDVSWAVVQRSQGFLDGGDRSLVLDSKPHMALLNPRLSETPSLASSETSDSSQGSMDPERCNLVPITLPTNSLLVKNLPTLLFSQAQDLHPLFFPFGHIEKLEIVHVSAAGSMSVIVGYSSATAAQEARDSLCGQFYGNFQLEAEFVEQVGISSSATSRLAGGVGHRRPPPLERRRTDPSPWSSRQAYAAHNNLPSSSIGRTGLFDFRTNDALHPPLNHAVFAPRVQQSHGRFDDLYLQRPTSAPKWTFELPSTFRPLVDVKRPFSAFLDLNSAPAEQLCQSSVA